MPVKNVKMRISMEKDAVVGRFSGGTSGESGRFFATKSTVRLINNQGLNPKQALKLPPGNTAENFSFRSMPKGTTVSVGRVAGGHSKATQVVIRADDITKVKTLL